MIVDLAFGAITDSPLGAPFLIELAHEGARDSSVTLPRRAIGESALTVPGSKEVAVIELELIRLGRNIER